MRWKERLEASEDMLDSIPRNRKLVDEEGNAIIGLHFFEEHK